MFKISEKNGKGNYCKFGVPSEKLGSHGEKADKLINKIEYRCTHTSTSNIF